MAESPFPVSRLAPRGYPLSLKSVRLLDRYLLREWAKLFALSLAALAGLALLSLTYRNAPEFLDWDAGVGDFVGFLALRLVGELPLLIPVALLISIIFVLAQLNRNQELAAARAAGLSIARLTAPLWFAAGACGLALAGLNGAWVSSSLEASREISERVEFAAVSSRGTEAQVTGSSEIVAFDSGDGRRRWIVGRLAVAAGRASDVHLHLLDASGREERRIVARTAEFTKQGAVWQWTFREAREFIFEPASGALLRQPRHAVLGPIPGDNPELMAATAQRAKDLSFRELAGLSAQAGWFPEGKTAQYSMRYHGTLASPIICLVVVAVAIPFAVLGGRVNPMIGVSKTLGLFLIYYFANLLMSAFGSSGTIPPVLAAWIPPLALAAWAWPRLRAVN